MTSVADLIDDNAVATLARPSNLRLGHQIAAQDGVTLMEITPQQVRARVGGVAAADQVRTVVLQSTEAGLTWSCTCTRNPKLFCKHCVATACATREQAAK